MLNYLFVCVFSEGVWWGSLLVSWFKFFMSQQDKRIIRVGLEIIQKVVFWIGICGDLFMLVFVFVSIVFSMIFGI